ncbi:MAG: CPBP family intramembrane glutamic endopeptidase, partial [Paraclostridium sp.]
MFKENRNLISEARTSKKLPSIVWAIILALVFLYGGSIIGSFALIPIFMLIGYMMYEINNMELIMLFISLTSFLFITLVIFFRVKVIEKRSISSLGFSRCHWFKQYALGFLIGIVMMSAVVLLLTILGCVKIETNPSQPVGLSSMVPLLIVLIGWIIQGSTEEILARGWLMNVLGARYNITLA